MSLLPLISEFSDRSTTVLKTLPHFFRFKRQNINFLTSEERLSPYKNSQSNSMVSTLANRSEINAIVVFVTLKIHIIFCKIIIL